MKMNRRDSDGDWMKGAVKHPGALHKALHIPMDKKISHADLEKAENSRNPKVRKQAQLAETFEKYRPK